MGKNMWKVMIADDENYMLEAMENLIDWNKMECQLVFKAKNGHVLLEQIKKNPPDIIITDIKMPLVTGIEVAKYVYENGLPIKVIILSAYADFLYAQEAIKYDVCGYIIKTSAIEMLPSMIDKAIKQLSGALDSNKENYYGANLNAGIYFDVRMTYELFKIIDSGSIQIWKKDILLFESGDSKVYYAAPRRISSESEIR